MHDISDLEARGLPGVFVASAEFVVAAEAQDYADAAFEEIVKAVTA